jgi:hypothetical protein
MNGEMQTTSTVQNQALNYLPKINRTKLYICFALTIHLFSLKCISQIPVEVFAGHKRATFDIMFFKFFKNKESKNSNWLFFNRNRVSVDYRVNGSNYLPQFGFTEAISYNHPSLKGIAPVAVAQVLNNGVYAKLGIQYAFIKKDFTIFTWLVSQTTAKPDIDHFVLLRYTPKISNSIDLFTQLESLQAHPTDLNKLRNFVQRVRLGIQKNLFQFGLSGDFSQVGRSNITTSQNIGIFIRYEF